MFLIYGRCSRSLSLYTFHLYPENSETKACPLPNLTINGTVLFSGMRAAWSLISRKSERGVMILGYISNTRLLEWVFRIPSYSSSFQSNAKDASGCHIIEAI
jgi:hypothetical protein